MARALTKTTVGDREKTASRLLASSARKSYDPEIDVDWDAPLDEDKHYLLPHRVSLYGTPMWERMTEEQRRELGRHEMATIASVGLWFELLLMKMLVKASYNGDATTRHIQYALTEVADECRHVTMFARLVERIGCPAYGPPRFLHEIAKVLPAISYGPALYGSVLVAEEITDRLQREMVGEETVQPLVRMVNHIHIVEEARHVTFAREEVIRGMTAGLGRAELRYQQTLIATVAFAISRSLLNPRAYAAVGLDPKAAWRAAHANPHYRRTMRYSGEKIMPFLQEHGLVGGPARHLWRRAYLLP